MTEEHTHARPFGADEYGIVTRSSARRAGYSGRRVRRRAANGSLIALGANTFRLPGSSTSPTHRLRALVADVGGDVWASGPTAAALHGFDGFELGESFHITVPRGRNIARVGHRVHTSTTLPLIDRASVRGVPVLSPARTLIDLSRLVGVDRLVVAFDSGLRDGGFSEAFLHRRIVALASKGRHGIPKLLEAISTFEHGRGGHSWLEREFLRIAAAAGLPRPEPQVVLARAQDRAVRVDFAFPGTNLVVEVLGLRYHRTASQLDRDAARSNALVGRGYRVFQFTYRDVVERGDEMVTTLRTALAA